MRIIVLAAAAAAAFAIPVSSASAHPHHGPRGQAYGYYHGGGSAYARELRECRRELRRANRRREYMRERRECRRELRQARYEDARRSARYRRW